MADTWTGTPGWVLAKRSAKRRPRRELLRIRASTIATRVLVVDDEPAFRDAAQQRLERRGYAVVAEAVDPASGPTDVPTPVGAHGESGLCSYLRT
jgi:hypothetical protein